LSHLLPRIAPPPSRNVLHLELAAETLRLFSEVRFVAHGTSMLPAIYPGDALTVKSFGPAAPHCGEIVLCRRAGVFRVHRIARIWREGRATFYVLRGDALTEDDPPVPSSDLLGRVTSLVRQGKSLELNSAEPMHHRVLRSIVRRSKIAAALLLRWHTLQARHSLRAESLLVASAKQETECA
jgi:hypothetical protein